MKKILLLVLVLLPGVVIGEESIVISFNGSEYTHRWSQDAQHEFTPVGQEDLSKWQDMLTLNIYAFVKDGEGLASAANSVLSNYQKSGAEILRTDSVPRTSEKEAEHLIVAVFGQPGFLEFVQARLTFVGETGASVIYSHRQYGDDAGQAMAAWIQNHGQEMEQKLMALNSFSETKLLQQLNTRQ